MAKTRETGDGVESATADRQEQPVSMKETSRDVDNGIVVFKTDAEDGTAFTLKVDDDKLHAKAEGGQVWFYAGRNLGETPNIRLA